MKWIYLLMLVLFFAAAMILTIFIAHFQSDMHNPFEDMGQYMPGQSAQSLLSLKNCTAYYNWYDHYDRYYLNCEIKNEAITNVMIFSDGCSDRIHWTSFALKRDYIRLGDLSRWYTDIKINHRRYFHWAVWPGGIAGNWMSRRLYFTPYNYIIYARFEDIADACGNY